MSPVPNLEEEKRRKERPGKAEIFFRLTRIQFIPLIILPALAGTTLAWFEFKSFNLLYFALVLLGVILLHLGANAIDDVYDYSNGVDEVANSLFPKDFGGWKPLPRKLITLPSAKIVSALLFIGSLAIGTFLWYAVGPWAFLLAIGGVLLAIFYTAPPLRLDYLGYGFGEIAIFLSFGPIPVLGAFYVETGMLSWNAFLLSIPIGLLTVTILIDHDMIFYEVYSSSKKLSLATVLGRKKALLTSLALTLVSYASVFGLVIGKILPVFTIIAPICSALLLSRKARTFVKPEGNPATYIPFTVNGLLSNWCFSFLLAILTIL